LRIGRVSVERDRVETFGQLENGLRAASDWAARFVKSRSAGGEAVVGGHVHINGERVKPAKGVRVGDTIEIQRGQLRWSVVVAELDDRRGPASVAATLYKETPVSVEAREQQRLERRLARPLGADLGGRPTKQTRRRIEATRRRDSRRR
jgi:ribosome-associated heat shock protein Hsp15